MRRLFWLALGVTLGVLIVRKLSEAAARFTPQGVSKSVGEGLSDLAASIGGFGADVRAAMREREAELRLGAGLDSSPTLTPRAEPADPQRGRTGAS